MIYVYLAAPVRPLEGSDETKEGNLALAREYYRRLSLAHPDKVFLAPWILNCEVFDETPEMIAKGMERNYAVIDLLATHLYTISGEPESLKSGQTELGQAELWLVGPHVSGGMQAEADYAESKGLKIERVVIDASDIKLETVKVDRSLLKYALTLLQLGDEESVEDAYVILKEQL
jgi:hypothetical protein